MNIPQEIKDISIKLKKAGFEAFLVGGCVRDLLLNKEPNDWDFATNAHPEKALKLFEPDSFYENKFGTVTVKTGSKKKNLELIEITTYRIEGNYEDRRHPEEVKFAKDLKDDLSRRDFTINALAFDIEENKVIDMFLGQEDLKSKLIRAVGEPKERFFEDALRLIRAVRLAVQLSESSNLIWQIEEKTFKAIKESASLINEISPERIREELIKILELKNANRGIELLRQAGLLKEIIPELEQGVGVGQNKHHIYEVYDHSLRSLKYASEHNFPLALRLAVLFHDVAKPQTKKGEGPNSTFIGHEIVGAKVTKNILRRLKFPEKIVNKVWLLVRYHMFYYNVGEVSEAGVRRFIKRVGIENLNDILKLREADRIGSGVPKAVPYRMRHLKFMIDKVRRDPISVKMLKINGNDIIKILKVEPGPKIGMILNALLEEVLDNPEKNKKEYLESRIQDLGKLSEEELKKLSEKGKGKKEEFESGEIEKIKQKHYVQ